MKTKFTIGFWAFMLWGMSSFAAGYQVLLQGNRQLAMGNMGAALRPGAGSVYWNPGALGFLDKSAVSAGVTFLQARVDYTSLEGGKTAETDSPLAAVPQVYAVWAPQNSNFRFGIGFYTPYGSSVSWGDKNWPFPFLLTEIKLKTMNFQPTAAYRINDKLSVGAGLIVSYGSLDLSRAMQYPVFDVNGNLVGVNPDMIRLNGKSEIAYGYNIGVMYRMSEKLHLGFNYKSKMDMKIEGQDVLFNDPKNTMPMRIFDSGMPQPAAWTLAATYMPNSQLAIGAEAVYMEWDAYKELAFEFYSAEGNALPKPYSPSVSARNYQNSWTLKLGAEYIANGWLSLRAGTYYDMTPVEEGYLTAETPDVNRLNVTAGAGIQLSKHFSVDLAFLMINGFERTQKTPAGYTKSLTGQKVPTYPIGKFNQNALAGGITLNYIF